MKIVFIENTGAIRTITLKLGEVCILSACAHEKGCAGKKDSRDNGFICNVQELFTLYRVATKRNKKIKAR